MIKWFIPRALVVLCLACGSEDDDVPQVCRDLEQKLAECGLSATSQCSSETSAELLCAAQCIVDADCSQVTGPVIDNEYYRCVTICSGGSPDSFICADGSGFIPPQGVCDGIAQCPDQSDEADCASGDLP